MNKHDTDYELPEPDTFYPRQPVELKIVSETDLGYKAEIDDHYIGLIYRDELSHPLSIGQYLKGWIKTVRPDGKIDLSITALDFESRDELQEDILTYLNRQKEGRANLSDKSPPEEIFKLFQASKKNFKRAIGALYKARLIVIADDHIKLVS